MTWESVGESMKHLWHAQNRLGLAPAGMPGEIVAKIG
jgi:hypothetical protein